MRELTTLELSILVKELNEYVGYHIEKFYDLEDGRFRIKMKERGKDANLFCFLCHALNKTQYIEKADTPTNFCMAIRKRITGSRISEINQLGNDRVIIFVLEKENAKMNLIFEMFGKGNLVLTDSSMKIMLAYAQHTFKDRSIHTNSTYMPPTKETRKEGSAISRLSSEFELGPIYIENALRLSGIDAKTPYSEIKKEDLSKVTNSIKKIKEDASGMTTVYLRDNEVVDYSLGKLKRYEGLEEREFSTMQEALDFVYSNARGEAAAENPEVKKFESSLNKQKALIDSLDKGIQQNKEIGQLLFAHMHEINQIIEKARSNRNITVKELQGAFPKFKIKAINLKDKSLTVELN